MKTKTQILTLIACAVLTVSTAAVNDYVVNEPEPIEEIVYLTDLVPQEVTPPLAYEDEIYEPEWKQYISEDDIDLMAVITMAEAEAEPELGQRLVIDTILNRRDSDICPDTIAGVVYQAGQFECVTNGRASRCYVRDDIRQLVIEELYERTDYDVWFFQTGGYSSYGNPMYKVCCHYFASYKY